MKSGTVLYIRAILAVALLMAGLAGIHAAPVNVELWARGTISLYDQNGEVFAGPEDWGVESPYNWMTLSWNNEQMGWSAIGEFGSEGWTDTSLRNISFYYKFLDGALKLSLAKPFVDEYTVHSYLEWLAYGSRMFDREYGFLIEYLPLAGLSLAGGCAIPIELDLDGSYPDAAEVYSNFRFAASYANASFGRFNLGYINGHDSALSDLDGKEFMVSANLSIFKPIGILLGYQGFFEGEKEQRLFGAATIPLGQMTLVADLMGQLAPYGDFQVRGQALYAFDPAFLGMDVWWLTRIDQFGVMPFVRFDLGNGYVKLGYRHSYDNAQRQYLWSIPFVYDIWF